MTHDSSAQLSESTGPGRVLLNLTLAAVSLVITLVAAEGLVRLVAPQQLIVRRPDVWQPADSIGYKKRPNVRTTVNRGERTVTLVTDSSGYRVSRSGRVEAPLRVLLLGDSFMEALQVEYEQSLAGLLESHLPQRVGSPVAVRNTAVGGWDPSQYLLQARRSLSREDFSLVLVALFVGNDVVEDIGPRPPRKPDLLHELRLPDRLSWGAFVDAVLYPINDHLETRSHLFILFKRATEVIRMRLGLSPAYFPIVYRTSQAGSPRWDATADACQQIDSLARSNGAESLFLLLPDQAQVDPEALEQLVEGFGTPRDSIDLKQPNRVLREELRSRGLDVIDLLPAVRRAFNEGRELYGAVDSHFTSAGHELVAQQILPAVAAALESGSPDADPRP